MKIDLSCPVEVWEASCPTPEQEACRLKLFNLTDKTVTSVEINVFTEDKNGRELQHVIHRCYSLHGRPHSAFEAGIAMEYCGDAVRAEATAMKVWFDDNTVWRKDRTPLTEYTSNVLPPCKDLDMLQYIAGPGAIGFPEEQEQVWICICGRANNPADTFCARCRQTKARIFESYNRETIRDQYALKERQLALRSRAAREDNARLQMEREEEYYQKTAKETGDHRLLTALLITVVFTLLLFFVGIPGLRVMSAVYGMEHGHAAEAEQILTELRTFPGAEGQLERCRGLRAEQTLGSGNIDALAEAAEIFRSRGTGEADAMALTADYERAKLLMDQGSPKEARELFRSLGEYENSPELLRECSYRIACELFDSSFYGMALEEFSALDGYLDSAEKQNQCIYYPAQQYKENKEYNAAIAEFGRIPDYADSQEQIKACYWLKGASLEETDPAEAAKAYAEAGNYGDGTGKARALRYALAAQAEAAGDLAGAAELYRLAVPYEDALNHAYTCTYLIGERALEAGDYETAREVYATLPKDYRETEDRLAETRYRPATEAQKSGNWETAVNLFAEIPEYKDSAVRLEKCRYELARSLQAAGDYDAAAIWYEQLGEYADSAKQLNNCHYDRAIQHMEAGEYEEAAALFTVLGNYKDSSTRLKDAQALAAETVQTPTTDDTAGLRDFAVEDE